MWYDVLTNGCWNISLKFRSVPRVSCKEGQTRFSESFELAPVRARNGRHKLVKNLTPIEFERQTITRWCWNQARWQINGRPRAVNPRWMTCHEVISIHKLAGKQVQATKSYQIGNSIPSRRQVGKRDPTTKSGLGFVNQCESIHICVAQLGPCCQTSESKIFLRISEFRMHGKSFLQILKGL